MVIAIIVIIRRKLGFDIGLQVSVFLFKFAYLLAESVLEIAEFSFKNSHLLHH